MEGEWESKEEDIGGKGCGKKGQERQATHTHVRKKSQDFRIDRMLKTNVAIKCILYSGNIMEP